MERPGGIQWMTLAILGALVLGCAQRDVKDQMNEVPANATQADESGAVVEAPQDLLDKAAREQELRRQHAEVMYTRHYAYAKRYRDAGRYEDALFQIDRALFFKPSAEEASRMRAELLHAQGERSGATATLLEDEWEARRARYQQNVVAVRRKITEGRRALDAGNHKEARRAFEAALFIVETSRRKTLGSDAELRQLEAEVKRALER